MRTRNTILKTIRSNMLLAGCSILLLTISSQKSQALPLIIINSASCDGAIGGIGGFHTNVHLVLNSVTATSYANAGITLYLYYRVKAGQTCTATNWQLAG